MAVKRAGMYNRLNAEDAVNFMIEDGKLSGTFEKNIECWDSLHFGLSDAFTERALREITEDYLRLGLITNTDLTVDEIMEKAWTPVCPDEIIPDWLHRSDRTKCCCCDRHHAVGRNPHPGAGRHRCGQRFRFQRNRFR